MYEVTLYALPLIASQQSFAELCFATSAIVTPLLAGDVGFGVARIGVTVKTGDDVFFVVEVFTDATVGCGIAERFCTGCMFVGYLTARYPPIITAKKTIEEIISENVTSGFICIMYFNNYNSNSSE